jgi:hypothetical protein
VCARSVIIHFWFIQKAEKFVACFEILDLRLFETGDKMFFEKAFRE